MLNLGLTNEELKPLNLNLIMSPLLCGAAHTFYFMVIQSISNIFGIHLDRRLTWKKNLYSQNENNWDCNYKNKCIGLLERTVYSLPRFRQRLITYKYCFCFALDNRPLENWHRGIISSRMCSLVFLSHYWTNSQNF